MKILKVLMFLAIAGCETTPHPQEGDMTLDMTPDLMDQGGDASPMDQGILEDAGFLDQGPLVDVGVPDPMNVTYFIAKGYGGIEAPIAEGGYVFPPRPEIPVGDFCVQGADTGLPHGFFRSYSGSCGAASGEVLLHEPGEWSRISAGTNRVEEDGFSGEEVLTVGEGTEFVNPSWWPWPVAKTVQAVYYYTPDIQPGSLRAKYIRRFGEDPLECEYHLILLEAITVDSVTDVTVNIEDLCAVGTTCVAYEAIPGVGSGCLPGFLVVYPGQ